MGSLCEQEEKAALEAAAAAAAETSAADAAALQQQLEQTAAELEAASADAVVTKEALAEAAAARDKAAAECSEHAEYSESIEGARTIPQPAGNSCEQVSSAYAPSYTEVAALQRVCRMQLVAHGSSFRVVAKSRNTIALFVGCTSAVSPTTPDSLRRTCGCAKAMPRASRLCGPTHALFVPNAATLNERELEVAGLTAQLEAAAVRSAELGSQLEAAASASQALTAARDELTADGDRLR